MNIQAVYELKAKLAHQHIEQGKLESAYRIFRELCIDLPQNPEYLFHAGKVGTWLQKWKESEGLLKKCLLLDSLHVDAALQLGYLFLYNQRWKEAEEVFSLYPNHKPAKAGLAKGALWKGDYPAAEKWYREILDDGEVNEEARLGLARSLIEQRKYREASVQYELLTQPDFQGMLLAPERVAVASHTRISLLIDADYMQSKENDPQLKAPVAKDYGFATSLSLFFPVADLWRVDAKGTFYHQKENNIYPPALGVNYNALLGEGAVTSRYYFKKDWRWDLYAKVIGGWKDGSMTFPFQHKTLFEPGTTLFYNSKKQFFVINALYDSMLIKNYARRISQLLLFGMTEGGYGYRFDVRYHPELEGRVGWAFYHGSLRNIQNRQDLWVRTGVPLLPKMFTVIYHFEHASFAHLSPNYYSYKNKWLQGLGARVYRNIFSHAYFELFYEHTWDLTLDLIEPIGTFIFVAPRQYLNGNKIYGLVGYSKNRYKLELSGHYFHNNLPYTDWNTKGSLQWQF